jgi:hypothetical protein
MIELGRVQELMVVREKNFGVYLVRNHIPLSFSFILRPAVFPGLPTCHPPNPFVTPPAICACGP